MIKQNDKIDIVIIVKWSFGCGSIAIWIGLLVSSIVNFEKMLGLPTFIVDILTIILSFVIGVTLYLLFYWLTRKYKKSQGGDG